MTPEQIRELRETLRMTQEEFARRLGLQTRGAISHLESGRKVPVGPTLAALNLLAEQVRKTRKK